MCHAGAKMSRYLAKWAPSGFSASSSEKLATMATSVELVGDDGQFLVGLGERGENSGRLTEKVEKKLEAASLALLLAVLVQLVLVEPLQRLGPLDEIAGRLGVFLQVVAIHGGSIDAGRGLLLT